jgi:hypothetical protein
MRTTRRRVMQLLSCAVPGLMSRSSLGHFTAEEASDNKDNIHFPMRRLRPDEVRFSTQATHQLELTRRSCMAWRRAAALACWIFGGSVAGL